MRRLATLFKNRNRNLVEKILRRNGFVQPALTTPPDRMPRQSDFTWL